VAEEAGRYCSLYGGDEKYNRGSVGKLEGKKLL